MDQYIKEYGKRLFGLCLTLCANRADAEDLYQDTWLKVLKNMESFDKTQPFEPWLTRICVNTYRNFLRRLTKNPVFGGFSTQEEKDRVLGNTRAPEPSDYSSLHAAIDRLPEKLRTTVILYYFKDFDIKATALALSIPQGTVKSRLSKGRKKLKEALKDETDLSF